MTGRAAAYAILGLQPGADPAAVEQAYKRLIKQHHPDREGGDGERAAEIIHAYRTLRGGKAIVDPLQFNDPLPRRRRRRSAPLLAVAAAGTALALAFAWSPSFQLPLPVQLAGTEGALPHRFALRPLRDPMTEALHLEAIDAAVVEAVRLHRSSDEMALARASADCHRRLRDSPSATRFDRCSAFDDAVVGLQNRDPLRDSGPFAPLQVTGRQWSAASALSGDRLSIDIRLDRIRHRVEMLLAGPEDGQQQLD